MAKVNGSGGVKRSMEIEFQEETNQANELFFLRATLTQPVALDGHLNSFGEDSELALSSTRPPSARNWSVQLETPARCVIRTILSAPSEQEATQEVFRAIKVAFSELEVQPGRVAVKAPSIYAEIGYSQIQTPGTA
jgi:hypothetical protein